MTDRQPNILIVQADQLASRALAATSIGRIGLERLALGRLAMTELGQQQPKTQ